MASNKKKTKKKTFRPVYSLHVWGLDTETEKGQAVRSICKELSIPVRTIKETQLADPVGSIAGLIGFRPSLIPFEGEAPVDEFILFNNIPNKTMDAFLEASRNAKVSIPHKAMVTKFNKTWPLVELMHQITVEHKDALASQTTTE